LMQALAVARAVDAGAVAQASAPDKVREAVFRARAAAVEAWKQTK
jgi:hypothetical protein